MLDYLEFEKNYLSEYATLSSASKGRRFPISECDIRTEFQRDRDRILHCKSFRRLKHKTQVFLSPFGDHFRTRLTHTLDVAQISRTIARALRLNEDLVEAIALGHDLGHTPFGHAGERVLNHIMGHFEHCEQSLRIVDYLENDKGLNLTFEVRDGILNHRTAGNPSTLEGKVVQLSDKIAYINHDIDDAIRANILDVDSIPYKHELGYTHGQRIDCMVHDVIKNSYGKNDIVMSDEVGNAMKKLRKYLFSTVYSINSVAKKEEIKAEKIVVSLYEYYFNNIDNLPKEYINNIEKWGKDRICCDFIAGMTDTYAVKLFNEIFIPKFWS